MIEDTNTQSFEYATFPRRFPAYRWFKPLLVALLTCVFTLVFQMTAMAAGFAWFVAEGGSADPDSFESLGEIGSANMFAGPGMLTSFGSVAVMLPALALAVLIVRDRPFSSYSSSRGGFDWRAFAKCLGVGAAIYAGMTVFQAVAFPDGNATGTVAFTAVGFVLATLIVPLQAVAEEYVFRGLALQAFGSWTGLPAVGIAMSTLLFTLSHSYNLAGLVAVFGGAVVWGVLVWRTRGLEVTCAAHIMNNLSSVYVVGIGVGTISSEVDIVSTFVSLAVDVLYAIAVILLDKKFNWFAPKGDGAPAECVQ